MILNLSRINGGKSVGLLLCILTILPQVLTKVNDEDEKQTFRLPRLFWTTTSSFTSVTASTTTICFVSTTTTLVNYPVVFLIKHCQCDLSSLFTLFCTFITSFRWPVEDAREALGLYSRRFHLLLCQWRAWWNTSSPLFWRGMIMEKKDMIIRGNLLQGPGSLFVLVGLMVCYLVGWWYFVQFW